MNRLDSWVIGVTKAALYIGTLFVVGDAIQLGAMGQGASQSKLYLIGMGVFGCVAFLSARRLRPPTPRGLFSAAVLMAAACVFSLYQIVENAVWNHDLSIQLAYALRLLIFGGLAARLSQLGLRAIRSRPRP